MEIISLPLTLTHLFALCCTVNPPLEIGNGLYGRRRCVPIKPDTERGKYLNGVVVPGGTDIMIFKEGQTTHVNTNYVLKSAYINIRTEDTRSGLSEVLEALMDGDGVDPNQYGASFACQG